MENIGEFDGPQSVLDGVRVTYHFDEHGDEWVVRIHHPNGMTSLCGCPGEEEAKVVASCIASVVAVADCTFTETIVGGENAEKVAINNMLEYDAMRDAAVAAIGSIQKILE
jgi:hypothetical protein